MLDGKNGVQKSGEEVGSPRGGDRCFGSGAGGLGPVPGWAGGGWAGRGRGGEVEGETVWVGRGGDGLGGISRLYCVCVSMYIHTYIHSYLQYMTSSCP